MSVRPDLKLKLMLWNSSIGEAPRLRNIQHRVATIAITDISITARAITSLLVHWDVNVIDLIRNSISSCMMNGHRYARTKARQKVLKNQL